MATNYAEAVISLSFTLWHPDSVIPKVVQRASGPFFAWHGARVRRVLSAAGAVGCRDDLVIGLRPGHVAGDDDAEDGSAASPSCKRQRTSPADSHALVVFPAHQIILCKCDFFKAQVQRWQDSNTSPAAAAAAAAAAATAASRPTLQLTIDSAEQQPAAEAVIAAMYGVKEAVSNLDQQQLVHAAVIADRIQAVAATQLAVTVLLDASESEAGLAAAALEVLTKLCPWPRCLFPLLPAVLDAATKARDSSIRELDEIIATDGQCKVQQLQRLLLMVFGDLDSVWADQQQKQLLMELPLPAMQLLLQSDELCVASEDTMLFTATEYVRQYSKDSGGAAAAAAADDDDDDDDDDDADADDADDDADDADDANYDYAAARKLAPLVRAPHLSRFALSCAVLGRHVRPPLLASFGEDSSSKLKSLLSIMSAGLSPAKAVAIIRNDVPDAPASWLFGGRKIKSQLDGVSVLWCLPVSQLKQACRDSAETKEPVWLDGPRSPPLGGLAWRLYLEACEDYCDYDPSTLINLYAGPVDAPEGLCYQYTWSVSCIGHEELNSTATSEWILTRRVWSISNFFDLVPMCNGWENAVWAAKGLPATGDLELQLTVHSVTC